MMNAHSLKALALGSLTAFGTLLACSGLSDKDGDSDVRTHVQALTADAWTEGSTYQEGDRVSYSGGVYEAIQTHTAEVGAGWNPEATPALWSYIGVDDGVDEGTGGASSSSGGSSSGGAVSLGADADRILGFEHPTGDWTPSNGGVVTAMPSTLQGTTALGIGNATWSELVSVPVNWPGVLGATTLGFDVKVLTPTPEPGWWGNVSLSISIPSAGVSEWIGQQGLDETALDRYRRVEFQLTPAVVTALSQPHPDVVFKITVNRPDTSEPYLIDRLSLMSEEADPIVGEAPSAQIDDVLSFESLSYWSTSSGTPSLGTDPTDKDAALLLNGVGYVDITSRTRIPSLVDVGDVVTADVKLPSDHPNEWWRGTLGLTLHLPSQDLNWRWIATESLQHLTPGIWGKVQFQLPPDVQLALNASYSDLQIKLSLNVPPADDAYELDNIDFGQPRIPAPEGDVIIQIPLPKGATLSDVAIAPAYSAADTGEVLSDVSDISLTQSLILQPGGGFSGVAQRTHVAGAPILKSLTEVGDFWSTTGVFLDSSSVIHGNASLRAPTSYFSPAIQAPSAGGVGEVEGALSLGTNVPWADVASWRISGQFGDADPTPYQSDPHNQRILPPGDYGILQPTVGYPYVLVAGEYSFKGIAISFSGELIFDNRSGPIIVRNDGPLQTTHASKITVLDRTKNNIAIFHLSENTAFLPSDLSQGHWQAMLVAPNAYVKVFGGQAMLTPHQFDGSIYAKGVELNWVTLNHMPFERPDCGQATASCSSLVGCERIDTDRDSLADCEEERDQSPWTDPAVFNGVRATNEFSINGCGTNFTNNCEIVDEVDEIEACLTPGEGDQVLQYSGWSTTDVLPSVTCGPSARLHSPHFNDCQTRQWSSYAVEWAVLSKGFIYLSEAGQHCFKMTGDTDHGVCGSTFLPDEQSVHLGDGTQCFQMDAGAHEISWFQTGGQVHLEDGKYDGHSIQYCFGDSTACEPTAAIPVEILRPDFEPGPAGGPCSDDAECGIGDVCSDTAPFALGLEDLSQSVCWDGVCSSGTTNCGTPDSLCGNCVCQASCENKQCGDDPFDGCNGFCTGFCDPGELGCESDTDCTGGFRCLRDGHTVFGYESAESICVPEDCWLPSSVGPGCGFDGAACGLVCGATPSSCEGMECGTDPTTGQSCGTCNLGLVCNLQNTCSVPTESPPDDAEFSVVYDVGAMQGAYATSHSGEATYSIPLSLPPGAGGVEPQLGLSFQDTSNLRGPLGPGWRLTGISRIHRCHSPIAQDTIWPLRPQEALSETFCVDGAPLLLNQELTDSVGIFGVDVYQPAGDPSTKIHFKPSASAFIMYTADGRIHSYGTTEDSKRKVYDGASSDAEVTTESWYLVKTEDRFDNHVRYHYLVDGPQGIDSGAGEEHNTAVYPSRILYSRRSDSDEPSRRVTFNYTEKDDPLGRSLGYRNHTADTDGRLLESISVDTFDGAQLREGVRSYHIEYTRIPGNGNDGLQRVSEVRECVRTGGVETCLTPTSFTYDDLNVDDEHVVQLRFRGARDALDQGNIPPLNVRIDGDFVSGAFDKTSRAVPLDADGDGVKDLFVIVSEDGNESYLFLRGQISGAGEFSFADPIDVSPVLAGPPDSPLPHLPLDFNCMSPASVADLDGDGREEIVDGCPFRRGRLNLAFFSLSAEGELTEHVTDRPAFGNVFVGDIDGNGRPDFVQEIDHRIYFSDFVSYDEAGDMKVDFHRVGAFGQKSVNAPLFVDVDGDGVANFLRFDALTHQFYALGFARDTEANEVGTDVVAGIDGTNHVVVTHKPTWSPTRLSYQVDPLERGGYGNRDTARILDVNGDGLQDVWVQRSTFNAPRDPEDFEFKIGDVTIIDTRLLISAANRLNGMLGWGYHAGPSDIWLNQGGTFKRMKAILTSVDGVEPDEQQCAQNDDGECILISNQHLFRNSTVLDYDLDGRQELVMVSSDIQARFHVVEETAGALYFSMSTLPEFNGAAETFGIEYQQEEPQLLSSIPTWSDFDGDGNTDMVIDQLGMSGGSDPEDISSRLVFHPGRGDGRGRRLETITDGLGNHTKIVRAHAREVVDMSGNCGRDDAEPGNHPRCLRRLDELVSRVTRGAVDGDHYGSTSYSYEHPATALFLQRYFFSGRAIRGESDAVVDGQPEIVSTSHEVYGEALSRPPWDTPASIYPFLTAPTIRETELSAAPDLRGTLRGRTIREVRDYEFRGASGIPHMYERVEQVIDEVDGGEDAVSTVAESFDVDIYGLPDGYSRVIYDGSSSTVSRYDVSMSRDAGPEKWILDKVVSMTVSDAPWPLSASHQTFHYEHDPETGFVKKATKMPNTERELVTVYEPDSFGNIQQASNGIRADQFDYGESGIYLREVQNALGHVQSFGYDDALGKLTSFRNENNYRVIQEYDGFGRVVLQKAENGNETVIHSNIEYSAVAPRDVGGQSIRSKVRLTTTSDIYSGQAFEEYDCRGLLVSSKVPGLGLNGATPHLFTEHVYDWAGRRIRSSQEHLDAVDPDWTIMSYDKRGRPTSVESPQGTSEYRYASQRQYEDDFPAWLMDDGSELTHVTDPHGLERVFVTDHKGQTVLTAEGVTLAEGDAGLVSKVIMGAWDLPTRLIDPELNETVNRYTDDGLLTSTEDLDRGRTEWTYDSFGNVLTELGADGIKSSFTYDDIDRLLTRTDELTDGNQVSVWEYDFDVPGTLSQMTGPTGIRTEFEYEEDPRALPKTERHWVGDNAYDTDIEYDSLGRVSRVVYPSIGVSGENFRFAARAAYDAHSGRQVAVLSDDESVEYWNVEDVDYASQDVAVRLGNGVLEKSSYNSVTRHLESIQTLDASGGVLGELGYQHYANGQMLERSFAHDGNAHVRSFVYDRAGRLDTVTDDGEEEAFDFSPSGRLLSRTKFGAYTYDALQPHAVSVIGENEFTYDARGNQQVRRGPEIEGGWQTTTAFSRYNLPERIALGDPSAPDEVLRYEYGAEGQRVRKLAEVANVEVVTPGDMYEKVVPAGDEGSSVHKFRVFAGGREVLHVQYDSAAGTFTYSYLHRDHLNSVLFTTNEAGNRSDVRDFDAFGAALSDPSWTSSIDESFTGHKADGGLGLLEAGARMYDPKFGVFTSPDPMRVSGGGSQALNPFAYANNDPVNWFDPTGFEAQVVVCGSSRPAECGGVQEWPDHALISDYWGVPDYGETPSGYQYDPNIFDRPELTPQEQRDLERARSLASKGRGRGNVELLANAGSAGKSYPTWNAIGAYGTLALEIGSLRGILRGIITRAGGYLGLGGTATRGRIAQLGNLPPKTLGATDKFGNITIARGLSAADRATTLRHELVHRFFSPRQGTAFAEARANFGLAAYNRSQLVRFTEEALAEGIATGSIRAGIAHPLTGGYGITAVGLGTEGGLYFGGIGSAIYLGASQ